MADAMLSTRDKGSRKGSSSEGKGKSLKKNVCKDDKKVPSLHLPYFVTYSCLFSEMSVLLECPVIRT
jgi:hypothetical protein